MESIRNYINDLRQELENEIVTICEIPAPTFNEKKRGEYIAKRFEEEGLENVHQDEIGNVIGILRFPDPGRTLAIAAHMDTAFSESTEIKVSKREDRFYAPGVGDNSSNVAGLIFLARILNHYKNQFRGQIYFVSTVGEEALGDLMGMKKFVETYRDELDIVLVLDGQRLGCDIRCACRTDELGRGLLDLARRIDSV